MKTPERIPGSLTGLDFVLKARGKQGSSKEKDFNTTISESNV